MTRARLAIAAAAAALALMATAVSIASASGPSLNAPTSGPGPYYSGPVHLCLSGTNESVGYAELHSTQVGNCADGYRQVAVNELTPAFTLQLGNQGYTCTAATDQAHTAINCSVYPPPSPSPSASSSA